MVSFTDFESRWSLHAKRDNSQIDNFTNCLVKCDFQQTTPNIGILYIIGNNFLSRLTMWDSYLKIRSHLVQLHCQSFDSLSRKACFEFCPLPSTFVTNQGYHYDRGIELNLLVSKTTVKGDRSWSYDDVSSRPPRAFIASKRLHLTTNKAGYHLFDTLWSCRSGTCLLKTSQWPLSYHDNVWKMREKGSGLERER